MFSGSFGPLSISNLQLGWLCFPTSTQPDQGSVGSELRPPSSGGEELTCSVHTGVQMSFHTFPSELDHSRKHTDQPVLVWIRPQRVNPQKQIEKSTVNCRIQIWREWLWDRWLSFWIKSTRVDQLEQNYHKQLFTMGNIMDEWTAEKGATHSPLFLPYVSSCSSVCVCFFWENLHVSSHFECLQNYMSSVPTYDYLWLHDKIQQSQEESNKEVPPTQNWERGYGRDRRLPRRCVGREVCLRSQSHSFDITSTDRGDIFTCVCLLVGYQGYPKITWPVFDRNYNRLDLGDQRSSHCLVKGIFLAISLVGLT